MNKLQKFEHGLWIETPSKNLIKSFKNHSSSSTF